MNLAAASQINSESIPTSIDIVCLGFFGKGQSLIVVARCLRVNDPKGVVAYGPFYMEIFPNVHEIKSTFGERYIQQYLLSGNALSFWMRV
jgi:hypothetical protein